MYYPAGAGSVEYWEVELICPKCESTIEVEARSELGYVEWSEEECPDCGTKLEEK